MTVGRAPHTVRSTSPQTLSPRFCLMLWPQRRRDAQAPTKQPTYGHALHPFAEAAVPIGATDRVPLLCPLCSWQRP